MEDFYIDNVQKFTDEFIAPIMAAEKGTLAYQLRDEWAKIAVSLNFDKLYESAY